MLSSHGKNHAIGGSGMPQMSLSEEENQLREKLNVSCIPVNTSGQILSASSWRETYAEQVNSLEFQVNSALQLADAVSHWLISIEGLACACSGLLSVLVDKTASLWSPLLISVERNELISYGDAQVKLFLVRELWQSAVTQAKQSGCQILQLLIDVDDKENLLIYEQSGLPRLTVLSFHQLELNEQLKKWLLLNHGTSGRYALKLIVQQDQELLDLAAKLLEESYVESKDCPEVLEGKSGRDALNGYCQTGDRANYQRTHILFLAEESSYQGILILKEHLTNIQPDSSIWEIAYIGLPAKYRGQGKGSELLKKGLTYVSNHGGQKLVVAVDQRNFNAIKMYEKIGFEEFNQQALFASLLK